MLDELTPEEFDEWYAYYLVAPWGDEWAQAGTVAAEVFNSVRLALGSDERRYPRQYAPRFLTKKQRERRERQERAMREAAEQMDQQRYGAI